MCIKGGVAPHSAKTDMGLAFLFCGANVVRNMSSIEDDTRTITLVHLELGMPRCDGGNCANVECRIADLAEVAVLNFEAQVHSRLQDKRRTKHYIGMVILASLQLTVMLSLYVPPYSTEN